MNRLEDTDRLRPIPLDATSQSPIGTSISIREELCIGNHPILRNHLELYQCATLCTFLTINIYAQNKILPSARKECVGSGGVPGNFETPPTIGSLQA